MEYEEFEEFDTAAEWMAAQERLALGHWAGAHEGAGAEEGIA